MDLGNPTEGLDVSQTAFNPYRDRPISIGVVIFPGMDQIDFSGPFEVLIRLPDASMSVIGTEPGPFKDMNGFVLTPDSILDDAPDVDLLHVPGGPGQQALMDDNRVLGFISAHAAAGKPLFSVCTGALLCGAAGVLAGRRATTHWSAFNLLSYFGATPVQERVVLDGNIVSASGVTAGLDGALRVASLLRGEDVAQRIQLEIEYAPEPPFDAGTPTTAPRHIVEAAEEGGRALAAARLETAKAFAQRM